MGLESADDYADAAMTEIQSADAYREMAEFYHSRALVFAILAVASAQKGDS